MHQLRNVQEIFFTSPCVNHSAATIQICKAGSSEHSRNVMWLSQGKTGYWQRVRTPIIVLAIGREGDRIFDLWAGEIREGDSGHQQDGKLWVIRIKERHFTELGWVDLDEDGYESFYGKKAASSRIVIERDEDFSMAPYLSQLELDVREQLKTLNPGEQSEILREVWVRGQQHRIFRQNLELRWSEACSVHGVDCDGQLRASHIVAWSLNVEKRGDVNNGLLLSVPLDALFDSGLIAFSSAGDLLRSRRLSTETAEHFGLRPDQKLAWEHLEATDRAALQANLAAHRLRYAVSHGYPD